MRCVFTWKPQSVQDSASAQVTQEGHVQPAADVQRIVSEARRVVVV